MNQQQKRQPPRPDPLITAFYRELTPQYQIRSICRVCATVIIGDVTTGHITKEREHMELCRKSRLFIVKRSS